MLPYCEGTTGWSTLSPLGTHSPAISRSIKRRPLLLRATCFGPPRLLTLASAVTGPLMPPRATDVGTPAAFSLAVV